MTLLEVETWSRLNYKGVPAPSGARREGSGALGHHGDGSASHSLNLTMPCDWMTA